MCYIPRCYSIFCCCNRAIFFSFRMFLCFLTVAFKFLFNLSYRFNAILIPFYHIMSYDFTLCYVVLLYINYISYYIVLCYYVTIAYLILSFLFYFYLHFFNYFCLIFRNIDGLVSCLLIHFEFLSLSITCPAISIESRLYCKDQQFLFYSIKT